MIGEERRKGMTNQDPKSKIAESIFSELTLKKSVMTLPKKQQQETAGKQGFV